MARFALIASWIAMAGVGLSSTGDWPAFRGPLNNGTTPDAAPTEWGEEENVVWKIGLPGPGNGSPIAIRDRVLLTATKDKDGKQRCLLCFDAISGTLLWDRTAEIDKVMPTHKTSPYCGTTPASDGERVVVWHASAGLHCYDLDGRQLWSRDLGEFRHMWGYGTSPILYGDRVILHTGPGQRVFVTALELATGNTLWETDEPLEGVDRNAAGKYMGSWSSPLVTRVGEEDQILVVMPTRVNAYDPRSGKIVWSCAGVRHDRGDLSYSSPVIAGDLCVVTGGFRGPSLAIRLGGSGDVTATHRLWRTENSPQNIGSAVQWDGFVYRVNAGPGTIDCLDPATGEIRWTERGSGIYWASLVMAGGLMYATDRNATTIVFRPRPDRFELVARNSLNGGCQATSAFAGGRIYFRTDTHLYCVGG